MTDRPTISDQLGFRVSGPPAEGSTLDLDAAAREIWDEFCPVRGIEWSAVDKERCIRTARACFRTLLPATDPIADAVMWMTCGTISATNMQRKRELVREGFAAAIAVVLGEGWHP